MKIQYFCFILSKARADLMKSIKPALIFFSEKQFSFHHFACRAIYRKIYKHTSKKGQNHQRIYGPSDKANSESNTEEKFNKQRIRAHRNKCTSPDIQMTSFYIIAQCNTCGNYKTKSSYQRKSKAQKPTSANSNIDI